MEAALGWVVALHGQVLPKHCSLLVVDDSDDIIIITLICLFCVCGQRTSCESQFSSSTMCVLGISSSTKCCHTLRHLTSPDEPFHVGFGNETQTSWKHEGKKSGNNPSS